MKQLYSPEFYGISQEEIDAKIARHDEIEAKIAELKNTLAEMDEMVEKFTKDNEEYLNSIENEFMRSLKITTYKIKIGYMDVQHQIFELNSESLQIENFICPPLWQVKYRLS